MVLQALTGKLEREKTPCANLIRAVVVVLCPLCSLLDKDQMNITKNFCV